MQRKRDGVWKRILALPLCACLLVSCSMRAVRVQNPVLSSGQEAPTVNPRPVVGVRGVHSRSFIC